ncbi:MAG TPA: putative toxin-antitoxin system toxin component, PIN family [Candidatus Binatia bacterium]
MPLVALLDTNVWVSAFLKPNGPPGQVITAWADDEFSVVTSLLQLSEITDVIGRPRLIRRFRYSQRDAEVFVRLIAARATVVQTSGELQICRDPDDDRIVEAAIGGQAQYLVTRDDDLKRDLDLIKMVRRSRVRVVSVRQFLRRLAREAKR